MASGGDFEDLDLGTAPGRRFRRWWWLALVLAVAALGTVALVERGGDRPSRQPSAAVSTPAPTLTASFFPAPPVSVTQLGRPLLPVASGWVLYGLGEGVVVRVDPGRGEITRTTIPPLQSGGPVSFLAMGGVAFVRPLDFVPGYVVPDGRPARPMPARLAQSGPMLPGPEPDTVWIAAGQRRLALVSLDGHRLGPTLTLPRGTSTVGAAADGGGYVLVPTGSGIYDVTPRRARRITTGALAASGRAGWLVDECGARRDCPEVFVDRHTGQRRAVGSGPPAGVPFGAISPDGSTAAVYAAHGASVRLELVDLHGGPRRLLGLSVDQSITQNVLTWSPDGRWLLALTENDRLRVVDARTGAVRTFGVSLPVLTGLAVATV